MYASIWINRRFKLMILGVIFFHKYLKYHIHGCRNDECHWHISIFDWLDEAWNMFLNFICIQIFKPFSLKCCDGIRWIHVLTTAHCPYVVIRSVVKMHAAKKAKGNDAILYNMQVDEHDPNRGHFVRSSKGQFRTI